MRGFVPSRDKFRARRVSLSSDWSGPVVNRKKLPQWAMGRPHKDLTGNICLFGGGGPRRAIVTPWHPVEPWVPRSPNRGRPPTEARSMGKSALCSSGGRGRNRSDGDRPFLRPAARKRSILPKKEDAGPPGARSRTPPTTDCPSKVPSRRRGPLEVSVRNDSA